MYKKPAKTINQLMPRQTLGKPETPRNGLVSDLKAGLFNANIVLFNKRVKELFF
jgi:hypothetical protein